MQCISADDCTPGDCTATADIAPKAPSKRNPSSPYSPVDGQETNAYSQRALSVDFDVNKALKNVGIFRR